MVETVQRRVKSGWRRAASVLVLVVGTAGWASTASRANSGEPLAPEIASGAENPRASAVAGIVAAAVDARRVPSLVIGVYHDGETHVYGFGSPGRTEETGDQPGNAATDHPNPVPNGRTVYEIGSVSKVFTGLLLAEAVERGEVRLDDPISTHLPEGVRAPDREGDVPITFEHLATHRSGLPRLPTNFFPNDFRNPYAGYGRERLHAFLNAWQPTRGPGEQYEYSNLGTGLLGYLLVRAADAARPDIARTDAGGTPAPESDNSTANTGPSADAEAYGRLVRQRIAEPLGLLDTGIALTPEQKTRLAPPHARGNPSHNWELAALAGAGGILSTADDMLRFITGLMPTAAASSGTTAASHDHPRLNPAVVERAATDRAEAFGGHAIGLGWHIQPASGVVPRTIWHNGATGGYASMLIVGRDSRVGVVVLGNGAEPGMMEEVAGRVFVLFATAAHKAASTTPQ